MVRFETSLKGEISVFEREVDTGIDVLVRSEAGDEMELFNHPETSSLLGAVISDGFVSLHFE